MQGTKRQALWSLMGEYSILPWPLVHARTNNILKLMKVIGVPHHYCSANYFWIELCGSMAIFTNSQISYFWSGVQGAVLISVNAVVSFFAMVTQVNHLFTFFHIVQHKFHEWHIDCIMHKPWQSLQFCMDFNHLRVVLIVYYKCIYLIIQFNPGATMLFLHTSFLSLLFNILTEIPVASSSINFW